MTTPIRTHDAHSGLRIADMTNDQLDTAIDIEACNAWDLGLDTTSTLDALFDERAARIAAAQQANLEAEAAWLAEGETPFTKENLKRDGQWLHYWPTNSMSDRKFVARFKVGGIGSFATFLRKNFTVEEYFARLEDCNAPLTIAESKGYLLPHIKRQLAELGYPLTQAGFRRMIEAQVAAL